MAIGIGIGIGYGQQRRNPLAALLDRLSPGAAQLILHPLQYGRMFQDRAGTVPVTATGQLVGRVLDAGPGGHHAEAVSDAARGVFRDVGGYRWVDFNGINTAYQTPVLPAPGVDKVMIAAAVRKESDDAFGAIVELSTSVGGNDGAFYMGAPNSAPTASYSISSKGTVARNATAPSAGLAAPNTSVLVGLGDISGQSSTLRINGVQAEQALGNKGAGNYNPAGEHPLFIGARNGGTSGVFTGRQYAVLGGIIRFSATNASPELIAAVEAYLTARTPL